MASGTPPRFGRGDYWRIVLDDGADGAADQGEQAEDEAAEGGTEAKEKSTEHDESLQVMCPRRGLRRLSKIL